MKIPETQIITIIPPHLLREVAENGLQELATETSANETLDVRYFKAKVRVETEGGPAGGTMWPALLAAQVTTGFVDGRDRPVVTMLMGWAIHPEISDVTALKPLLASLVCLFRDTMDAWVNTRETCTSQN